jgi:anti-sigma regulatory factor (Ser/Thr protein kinase)
MVTPKSTPEPGFRHEALLYEGPDGFLQGTVPFIREGIEAEEPVLVVVADTKIRALRAELNGDADRVVFADMAEVGLNPARIIPAWQDFLDRNGAGTRPVRGIGEPIWAGRGHHELVEAQRHESLLNVAFTGSGTWSLLCPYDRITLDPAVLEEAERSHPYLVEDGERRPSTQCRDLHSMAAPFDASLGEPPELAVEIAFTGELDLGEVRTFVAQHAQHLGAGGRRASELVLAAHEVASNSVRYGGGGGVLRMWVDGDAIVCEVRDRGRLENPLAGRERPGPQDLGGRGLWMANQLCDLVQLRTYEDGNAVRLHLRRVPETHVTS